MYKVLWFISVIVVSVFLHAVQIEQEAALRALLQAKNTVNRAVHAAAQQVDQAALAEGKRVINPVRAKEEMLQYIQYHLNLDELLEPLPNSLYQSKAIVDVFDVIQEDQSFPYIYTDEEKGIDITLQKPGVILILRLEYPRAFSWIEPFGWDLKAAAEIVYDDT